MKTDIAYIYALLDPRDNEVRYIGKTKVEISTGWSESQSEACKGLWSDKLVSFADMCVFSIRSCEMRIQQYMSYSVEAINFGFVSKNPVRIRVGPKNSYL